MTEAFARLGSRLSDCINAHSAVIPVLVTGIRRSAIDRASGEMDPGHKARDDRGGDSASVTKGFPAAFHRPHFFQRAACWPRLTGAPARSHKSALKGAWHSGSALPSHGRGHRFDPCRAHHSSPVGYVSITLRTKSCNSSFRMLEG